MTARPDGPRHLLPTATSADVAAAQPTVAVLPVGSFEQHGRILPLATDTMVAAVIAARLADDYGLFLLPPVTISCSHEHAAYPGTVSISHSTLTAIITDIRRSLRQSGITRLVLVNGHGGNYVLSNIVQEANVSVPEMILFPARQDWEAARQDAGLVTSASEDMHAGELEVSLLLHAYPELVGQVNESDDHDSGPRPHLLTMGMPVYTPSGIIGRPSAGTPEKGRMLLGSLSRSFKEHLGLIAGQEAQV
ncbi:creatininase family protein [Planomonospora parontospora]|uniref:creatininase family protein n=1 Tax=Planomonospora parontospora TaxID=58119 RepID=UPI00166FF4A5|nr:creatininase family protein [Planomonospora parontospora]GGL42438.1 creatinine amidohydrolase [Planomonospora parontospora subsp. antibiotica]GII18392.1 creatinine amidohydrolase [Planomonospora parontospora subsp. antibiotica]